MTEGELLFSQPTSVTVPRAPPRPPQVANAFEALLLSPDGGVLVAGWVDDAFDPVANLQVRGDGWRIDFEGASLVRVRRADLPALAKPGYAVGYACLAYGGQRIDMSGPVEVELRLASGVGLSSEVEPRVMDDETLRETALGWLATADYPGAASPLLAEALDRYVGPQILDLNRAIVGRLTRSPYVERFGSAGRELTGSIVVCVYGKVEYVFLQAALYARRPGLEAYEFIYVVNSPEISERVLAEARLAALTYGLMITVVILAGNAGFAAANNVAAAYARTDRLLFVNPDVFPKDEDWALQHSATLLSRPASETRLFGTTLYYEDGSLMHAGMYLDADQGALTDGLSARSWRLLRVEHFGKGAPPADTALSRSRPVPMVTGAFISVERDGFERLDGFSTDYVFGHYEDADLCLRSLDGGTTPWLHPIPMYHLEGKGSGRRPAHEGGSIVNRWLFTSRWGGRDDLFGRAPSNPLLTCG